MTLILSHFFAILVLLKFIMSLERNFRQDRQLAREAQQQRGAERKAEERLLKARENRRADEGFADVQEKNYRPGAGGAYVEGCSDPGDFKSPRPEIDQGTIEAMADDVEIGTHKERKAGIQDVKRISSRKQVRIDQGWVERGAARQSYGKKYSEGMDRYVEEATKGYGGRQDLAEWVRRIQTEKSVAY